MKTLLLTFLVAGPLLAQAADSGDFIGKAHHRSETDERVSSSVGQLNRLTAKDTEGLWALGAGTKKASTIGLGIPIYMVGLNPLAELPPETSPDPLPLLIDLQRVFYPVLCGEKVCSGVQRVFRNGAWSSSMLGGDRFAVNTMDAIAALHLKVEDVILVDIPAMNLHFVGFMKAGTLMLASSYDSSMPGITRNEPRPASEVFRSLRQPAKDHNRQPT